MPLLYADPAFESFTSISFAVHFREIMNLEHFIEHAKTKNVQKAGGWRMEDGGWRMEDGGCARIFETCE